MLKNNNWITNIVGFVEHNNRAFLQFFGNKVSYFWIQQVMIAVHNNICMINLKQVFKTALK